MTESDDLRELVLAAVSDDIEEFDTIVAIVNDETAVTYGTDQVMACVSELLRKGHLHAWEAHPTEERLVPVYKPDSGPDALARYWYKPSDAGVKLCDELRKR